MASSGIPAHPTVVNIRDLLPKLQDQDPDFRYMGLNDLIEVLDRGKDDILRNDFGVSMHTADALVRALGDHNGEVQQLALKW
jgi:cullin-associated NEDD8-dissociated protein 1